jgi:hypothetical protein
MICDTAMELKKAPNLSKTMIEDSGSDDGNGGS